MILIATITLFSFTEGSGFSSLGVYSAIEIVAFMSMLVARGAEFVAMATNI